MCVYLLSLCNTPGAPVPVPSRQSAVHFSRRFQAPRPYRDKPWQRTERPVLRVAVGATPWLQRAVAHRNQTLITWGAPGLQRTEGSVNVFDTHWGVWPTEVFSTLTRPCQYHHQSRFRKRTQRARCPPPNAGKISSACEGPKRLRPNSCHGQVWFKTWVLLEGLLSPSRGPTSSISLPSSPSMVLVAALCHWMLQGSQRDYLPITHIGVRQATTSKMWMNHPSHLSAHPWMCF